MIRPCLDRGVTALLLSGLLGAQSGLGTPLVDTGQNRTYDATQEVAFPRPGRAFHGQDAQYVGELPAYHDNGDGTITDLVTGLMWQKTPDLNNKSTFAQARDGASTFRLAGHTDWRLPSIKELYSLIDFRGSSFTLVPYLDTDYFDFRFGDPSRGERVIDAQYWSSTEYVGTTMGGDATVFGVNFADGRIKGYPRDTGPGGSPMREFVRYVRGPTGYGTNRFVDNGDGTVSDLATGLQWAKADSPTEMNWEQALAYAEGLTLAGHDDWRLPNAKELQSIVDYTRAPDATIPAQRGPAIDPIFVVAEVESYAWTGTTHLDGPQPSQAVYVCFGRALGYLGPPGLGSWVDVHGAGAQRSDPKSGDPNLYPYGRGPQGDDIRIYNRVRCVRGGVGRTLTGDPYALTVGQVADVRFSLTADPVRARQAYVLLVGLSGTRPVVVLPSGIELPLAIDGFTAAALALVNTPAFVAFAGMLDGTGAATAYLHSGAPLPAAISGLDLTFAYVLAPALDYASNAVVVSIEG